MQTGPLLTAALALLISSAPLSSAAEILSQQIELNSSSSVSPANGGFGSGDQDNRGNQGVGNRSLETSTQTIFQNVEVYAEANINYQFTNSPTSDTFQVHSRIALDSDDFLLVPSTQLHTRAQAFVNLTVFVRFDTPVRYDMQKTGHFNLPGGGGLTITAPNGNIIVNQGWTTGTTAPSEASGIIPPGTYTIRFSDGSSAEGMVSSAFVNEIGGDAQSMLTLTFSPAGSVPIPPPSLNLLRDSTNRVVLELINLQPGTFYTIERGDSLQPNSFQPVTQFVAAGTTATWTDVFSTHTPTTFYRLRF
jgi:hypothetical protein